MKLISMSIRVDGLNLDHVATGLIVLFKLFQTSKKDELYAMFGSPRCEKFLWVSTWKRNISVETLQRALECMRGGSVTITIAAGPKDKLQSLSYIDGNFVYNLDNRKVVHGRDKVEILSKSGSKLEGTLHPDVGVGRVRARVAHEVYYPEIASAVRNTALFMGGGSV